MSRRFGYLKRVELPKLRRLRGIGYGSEGKNKNKGQK